MTPHANDATKVIQTLDALDEMTTRLRIAALCKDAATMRDAITQCGTRFRFAVDVAKDYAASIDATTR